LQKNKTFQDSSAYMRPFEAKVGRKAVLAGGAAFTSGVRQVMSVLELTEELLSKLSRAEKAQVLQ
jgi:hypothetical protein